MSVVKHAEINMPPAPEAPKTAMDVLSENFDAVTISQFGKENFMQFKISEELTIDLDKLDSECARQSNAFTILTRVAAKARYDAKMAKLDVKIAFAKTADFLRSPQGLAAQGKKVTENSVVEAIDLQPEYIAAQKRHLEAEYVADVIDGLVEGYRQKKAMLMTIKGVSEAF